MTSQERRLVAALVGDGPRWQPGREFAVVWAEIRAAADRPADRVGKKAKKADKGKRAAAR